MENDKYVTISPTFKKLDHLPYPQDWLDYDKLWEWVETYYERTGFKNGKKWDLESNIQNIKIKNKKRYEI